MNTKENELSLEDQQSAYVRGLIAVATRELIEENRDEILRRAQAKHEENRKRASSET